MAIIHLDENAMAAAADQASALSDTLADCRERMLRIDTDLRAAGFQGQTAEAFSGYVTGVGAPALQSTVTMLSETATAIRHTCDQFETADRTLRGTFTG